MQKLSKIAFALPEVNILKPELRPLILTKILMFLKLSIMASALRVRLKTIFTEPEVKISQPEKGT